MIKNRAVSEMDLQLYNVIVVKTGQNQEVDLQKVEEIGTKLKKSGIYRIAPVVIHKDCMKNSLELMISVNKKVELHIKEFYQKKIVSLRFLNVLKKLCTKKT